MEIIYTKNNNNFDPIHLNERLDQVEVRINEELKKCREIVEKEKSSGVTIDSEDFNKRGELYKEAVRTWYEVQNELFYIPKLVNQEILRKD